MSRSLTQNEISLAKTVYQHSVDYSKVRINDYNLEQQASIITDYFRVVKRGWGFTDRIQNTGSLAEKKRMLTRVMGDFVSDPTYAVR